MRGLMQESQLSVTQILDYAAKWHPEQEVVCRTVEGTLHSSNYAEIHKRARLCGIMLQQQLGIGYVWCPPFACAVAWRGTNSNKRTLWGLSDQPTDTARRIAGSFQGPPLPRSWLG